MTVLVLSEGARDVGNLAEGQQGAVAVLVRRLLSEAWKREVAPWEVETDVLKRIHEGKGFERKSDLAVTEAQVRGHKAVVIVVDRDGPKNTTRLDALRRGRDESRGKGKPLAEKLAIGVAIETVEAWLQADVKALNQVLGLSKNQVQSPEELFDSPKGPGHPKTIFEGWIRTGQPVENPYDAVAELADLRVIEERCPKSFEPFAQEIRKL